MLGTLVAYQLCSLQTSSLFKLVWHHFETTFGPLREELRQVLWKHICMNKPSSGKVRKKRSPRSTQPHCWTERCPPWLGVFCFSFSCPTAQVGTHLLAIGLPEAWVCLLWLGLLKNLTPNLWSMCIYSFRFSPSDPATLPLSVSRSVSQTQLHLEQWLPCEQPYRILDTA